MDFPVGKLNITLNKPRKKYGDNTGNSQYYQHGNGKSWGSMIFPAYTLW